LCKKKLALFAALIFMAGFIWFLLAESHAQGGVSNLKTGSLAPELVLSAVDSEKDETVSFTNRLPAVVFFWYLSCENCVADVKFMRDIKTKYSEKLSFIAINVDSEEKRSAVKNFIKNNGLSAYKNYFDRITYTASTVSFAAADKYGVYQTPCVFLIGASGVVEYRAEHEIDFDELEKAIEKTIKM